jgi:hypothetical protein
MDAYVRCNSGHWFQGLYCPLDGWTSVHFQEIHDAVSRVRRRGTALSIDALKAEGLVSKEALARVLLIESGAEDSAFEAIDPAGYLINGRFIERKDFGSELL